MGARIFIQWGLLVCVVVVLILFEYVHLQVTRYNLFLLLLMSLAFAVILWIRILERRGTRDKERGGREEKKVE